MTQNWNNRIINFLVICLSLGTWPCHHVFKSCDLLLTRPLLSHPHFSYNRPESTLLDRTLLLTISGLTSSYRHRSTQRSPKAAFKNWDAWLCLVIVFKAWLTSEAHLNTLSISLSWLSDLSLPLLLSSIVGPPCFVGLLRTQDFSASSMYRWWHWTSRCCRWVCLTGLSFVPWKVPSYLTSST